jgi:hypothetical protein
MRFLLFYFCAAWSCLAQGFNSPASIPTANFVTSHSGQFLVAGAAAPLTMYDRVQQTNRSRLIHLDSHFLAVSAERVKSTFLNELNLPDQYLGQIHLRILERAPPTQPVAIISTMYADGWQFEVGLPGRIEEEMLLKGITQALLLEFSNRRVRRSAELPTWVVEGFTQEIANSPMPTFLFERKSISLEIRGGDELGKAREWLQTHPCLTIAELSFANLARAGDEDKRVYQSCAQLLTHELLELPNGPRLFSQFLSSLPYHWNWQTAFLKVYEDHFKSMLDFEKWWALTWIDFRGRKDSQTWSTALSLDKLRTLLSSSMETRVSNDSLPVRQDVSMQTLITKTDFNLQEQVILQKLKQLFFLKFNLSPDARGLAARYEETLKSYLDKRITSGYQPGLKQDDNARDHALVRELLKDLDALDQQQFAVMAAQQKTAGGVPPPSNSVVVQAQKKKKK